MSDEARFWTAVTTGDAAIVESMVRADSQLATARRDGVSAILLARYHHKLEVVTCLRRHVVTLDIFEASALGEGDRVGLLLESGPCLANTVAADGFSPLGLSDEEGRTAADHARARGHAAVAERLGSVACS